MSFYIYGLRLRGEIECRYVGQTGKTPKQRLNALISEARHRVKTETRAHPDGLWCWLVENAAQIEVFKIGKAEYREQARAMERVMIALVLRLGHRLLNVDHVPVDQRIGHIPTGWMTRKTALIAARRRATA